MTCNIKSTADEQYKAERKRFLNRMKPKPVVADIIKRKEERKKKDGSEKVNIEELQ